MASTKTETMLVWVELPPRCKLSAHLDHVGGFAAHLHHVAKIVGGSGLLIRTLVPQMLQLLISV